MTTNSLRRGADTLENTELGSGSVGDLVAGPVTGGKTAGATRRPFSYRSLPARRARNTRACLHGPCGPPKCMKTLLGGDVARTLVSAASRLVSTLFGCAPGPEHRAGFSTLPRRHAARHPCRRLEFPHFTGGPRPLYTFVGQALPPANGPGCYPARACTSC